MTHKTGSLIDRPAQAVARERISTVALIRWLLLALVLIAIGLRVWFIWHNPIDASSSTADDGDYYRRALRLAITGQYLDDSWLIRPPLHIFFFAAFLRVGVLTGDLGLGMLLIKLAQVALGAAQVLLGYGLARRLFHSRAAGLLFALFLAVWFPFVEQPSVLFSELLYATLFLAHYWLLVRFDQHNRWWDLALSGVCLGLAALTRSPALYSLAFVGLWLFVRQWNRTPHSLPFAERARSLLAIGRPLIVASVCCLAIVLPWTARNYIVYQRFIPVDTLGQTNLWLDLGSVDQRNPHIEELRRMPQADRAGYAMAKARELLADDPMLLFRNIWPTFQHIWKAQYIEDYYLKESFYDRPLREAAPLGLAGDLLWLVFTAAGLAALVGPVREGWHNRLFALAWVGYTLFTVVVFHVEPRYLLPLWLQIVLYGAGGLGRLIGSDDPITRQSLKSWLIRPVAILPIMLVLVFAVLVISYRNYPAIISRGVAREQAISRGEAAFDQGDFAAAEQAYRDALAIQPNFLDAKVELGLTQLAAGQPAEAAQTVADVNRRTAWLVGLVATGGGPDKVDELNFAEATTGLDIQRWTLERTRPTTTETVHLGDGRDYGYIAGFSVSEGQPSFRWMSDQGIIRLPLAHPIIPDDSLILRLTAPKATSVDITIDGYTTTLQVTPGGWRSYDVAIPSSLDGQKTLTIELHAPTFIPAINDPSSTDLRQISIMVSDVMIR